MNKRQDLFYTQAKVKTNLFVVGSYKAMYVVWVVVVLFCGAGRASSTSREHNQDRNESKSKTVLCSYWLCSLLWCWRFGFGCGTARARPHIENHTASSTARSTTRTETNKSQKPFCVNIGCSLLLCWRFGFGCGTARAEPRQNNKNDLQRIHRDNRTLVTGWAGCVQRSGRAARQGRSLASRTLA